MKFTKMSLVAALLIGSSAFAIENTKVTGDANVFYSTNDAKGVNVLQGTDAALFNADNSAADIGLNLNVTTDLFKNDMVAISAGAGYTVLSTLGLENTLVGNVWGGAHTAVTGTGAAYGQAAGGAKVENANWVNEAWVAATAGKSTVKVGRMELDTPLAFTETWSIEKNTFEAAVLINQDIPDTTLVAAFVGNGNGTENFGQNAQSNVQALNLAAGAVVNGNGDFTTYGTNGAFAVAAVNNSWKPLTAQAWYYDVTRLASAYWLQGDLDLSSVGVEGLTLGGQYTGVTADADLGLTTDTTTAGAVKVGYAMKDMFSASVAYSQVSTKGTLGHAAFNTATSAATAQSKLYTEAWWNYGQVTQRSAKAVNLTVESGLNGMADVGLYVTNVDHKAVKSDLTEVTLTAGKSFGPLDATVAYINTSVDGSDAVNTVQAYLTVNF
jgi:imipenem/basic amino acid-specific outer membrane pore